MSDLQELERALAQTKRGPAGRDGRDGRDGVDGVDGAPGPTGMRGIIGEMGPRGPQGEKGIDGINGERGEKGDRGDPGPGGLQGLPGRDGARGAKGDLGPQGPKGERGEPGPIGPMPLHEWNGTKLRFEMRPGRWGQEVDLQGPPGKAGRSQVIGGGTGAQGLAGAAGAPGVGVPTGGSSGQVLAKASGTNYDTHWVDQSGGGGGGGASMDKIASGTIASPVEYLDITLPIGYVQFLLVLVNFQTDGGGGFATDNLAWAFSEDAGDTFHNGNNDYNYISEFVWAGSNDWSSVTITKQAGSDLEGVIYQSNISPSSRLVAQLWIDPGSESVRPSVYSTGSSTYDVGSTYKFMGSTQTELVNHTGRVNCIRLLPWGNADVDPPTSGESFAAGSYVLYGHAVD